MVQEVVKSIGQIALDGQTRLVDREHVPHEDILWSVGADFDVVFETMPLQPVQGRATDSFHKKRVSRIGVLVEQTAHLNVNQRNIDDRVAQDAGFLRLPQFDNYRTESGLTGWDDLQTIKITQNLPVNLELNQIEWQITAWHRGA